MDYKQEEMELRLLAHMVAFDDTRGHEVLSLLDPEDFQFPSHAKFAESVRRVLARGDVPDILTVKHDVDLPPDAATDLFQKVLFADKMAVPVTQYARVIKDNRRRRELRVAGESLAALAKDGQTSVPSMVSQGLSWLMSPSLVDAGDATTASAAFDRAVALASDDSLLVPTGMDFLTTPWKSGHPIISGYSPSDLIIIAARPSMGKSAYLFQDAVCQALSGLKPVIFSLEMSAASCSMRIAQILSGKTAKDIVGDAVLLKKMRALVADLGIAIYDFPMTIEDITAKSRALRMAGKCDCILVDYLQFTTPSVGAGMREQEIRHISNGLKRLAKFTEVPVVAGAQINRGVEARASPIPQLSDLRESGAIEQDADVVVFLSPPNRDFNPTGTTAVPMVMHVAKQRNGPAGEIVPCFFNKNATKFQLTTNWSAMDGQEKEKNQVATQGRIEGTGPSV